MKRIALITDGWKNFFLYAWPDGVLLRMNEYDVDFTLYQYSCHGNWSTEKLHNQGEYNIYNMPNLKDFDGIIFECNNIEDDEVINHVLNLIRESGVPAVSVGKAFDGLYYVGGEEKKPIETMIKHMYEKHGARSFVYAGGRKEHFGNQCGVNAYLSSLKQYGLNSDDNPVIYGEFDFINGMTIFENYINSGRKLPDVFICACDNIAAGLCTQAERMGYAVPRDFKVTGFDNLDKAAYFEPQITTAEHNRGHITKKAAEVLINIWEGNQVGSHNYVDAECIFAESYGCDNNGRVNYRRY
ncbi:MAG: LacI family DNA-binding transcriptional regulator, partial [Lachnospiraceae bacterium]|nr:LacI family DNA-binding transcriptional regulator [Lachnospiraceae bacterium]